MATSSFYNKIKRHIMTSAQYAEYKAANPVAQANEEFLIIDDEERVTHLKDGYMSYEDKIYLDFTHSTTNVTSVVDLPITASTIIAEVSVNEALSLVGQMQAGTCITVIGKNTGTEEITIAVPNSGNSFAYEDSLVIAAGYRFEVSILFDGTTYYYSSKVQA